MSERNRHNPSDSLDQTISRRGLLFGIGAVAGAAVGCSPDNVKAVPEVPISSTDNTPEATGRSSSADTPSTEQATSKAPDTPKPSTRAPQNTETSPSTSSGEQTGEVIGTRMDHPNAIPAADFVEEHLTKDPQRFARENTVATIDEALDFATAADATLFHDWQASGYIFPGEEINARLPIYKDPRKHDAQQLAELLVKRGIAMALSQKAGSERGLSEVEDADVAPLDRERVSACLYAHYGPGILAPKPVDWGADGVAAQQFDKAVVGIVNKTNVVAGLTSSDIEITDATMSETIIRSMDGRTFETKDVSFLLDGEPFTLIAVFGKPKKQFSAPGHPERWIEEVTPNVAKVDYGKLRYYDKDGNLSDAPIDNDGDPTVQVIIGGVKAASPDRR